MRQKLKNPVIVSFIVMFFMAFVFTLLPCNSALADGKIVLNGDEQRFVDLINGARVDKGLQKLSVDGNLILVARAKASGSCVSVGSQLKTKGVSYSSLGQVTGNTFNVDLIVSALSKAYSQYTLFNPKFDRIGVGVVGNSTNKPFALVFIDSGNKVVCPQPQPVPQPQPKPQPQPQPQPKPVPQPEPKPVPQPQPQPEPPAGSLNADELQMFNLVNQERQKFGLGAYKVDTELVKLARLKATDMINLGYFSHTSPTYGSPFDMMKSFKVSYMYAGENLAGAPTVSSAHTNLMNSSGHRANILNPNFTGIGIGVVSGGPYGKMFVQMFKG